MNSVCQRPVRRPQARSAPALIGLIVLGVLCALPLLLWGFPPRGHDSVHHARWCWNFAAQCWAGELYPRWLADVNFGFGSPAFFYYPPLGYWVAAAFCAMFPGPREVWMGLGWASALALVLSGVTAWICFSRTAGPGRAWAASAFYMVGPYHLALGLYERAAYAEFWAYVWMPLIVRGVLGFQLRKRAAWGWTILGFAGLFLSHLPTTVTFTPLALLLALWNGWTVLRRTLLALMAAILVGAAYLVPCFAHLHFVSTRSMTVGLHATFFFPSLTLTQPVAVPDPFNTHVFVVFLGFLFTLLCHHLVSPAPGISHPRTGSGAAWVWLGWLVTFLMLPLSRPIYAALWPLQMIQFAWRFLAPASLIWAALLANNTEQTRDPGLGRACSGLGLLAALLALVAVSRGVARNAVSDYARGPTQSRESLRTSLDAREYLPSLASPWAARDALGERPVVVRSPEAEVSVRQWQPRRLQFAVDTPVTTTLWVHQLYYPGWRAWRDGRFELKVDASGPGRVIAVELPPGKYRLDLELTALPAERLGEWISLITLAGLAFLAIGRMRPQPQGIRSHPAAPLPGVSSCSSPV